MLKDKVKVLEYFHILYQSDHELLQSEGTLE